MQDRGPSARRVLAAYARWSLGDPAAGRARCAGAQSLPGEPSAGWHAGRPDTNIERPARRALLPYRAVYLAAADKYRRLTHRLSQEQKGLGDSALMVSPWPSHLW